MRLWTISDLHLVPRERSNLREFYVESVPTIPDADVAVIAGDFTDGAPEASMEWLATHIKPRMPVVAVLGNHDFYGENLADARKAATEAADRFGIHLLDDSAVTIAGVRFIGSTLWTDYELYADCDDELRRKYMYACKTGLADHVNIGLAHGSLELFSPRHALELHKKSRFFLEDELRRDFDGQTVVVTHHAPHPYSVAAEFAGDPVTPGFVSDMSDVFARFDIDLWVHGHTHTPFDYTVDGCRVVCNPRGYNFERVFDPEKVIDLSRFGPEPPGW